MLLQEDFAALIAGLEDEGYSRSQIANGAGVSRMTVWRIAEGGCRAPTYETVIRLQEFAAACNRRVTAIRYK